MIRGVSNNSLTLSWTSASVCLPLTYNYTYSTSSGTIGSYSTTSNQILVTGLSSGTAYTFSVYAKLNATNNQSNSINCTDSTGMLYGCLYFTLWQLYLRFVFHLSFCQYQYNSSDNKMKLQLLWAGSSIPPETMMHFPPLFQIPPYFRKIFRLSGKF